MSKRGYAFVLVVAVATASLTAVVSSSAATNNVSHASFGFQPTKVPKKAYKAGKITVHTDTVFASPGIKPDGGFTKRVQIYFDKNIKFNTKAAKTCAGAFSSNTTMALAMAQCRKAKIGTGLASTAPPSDFPGCVIAFNGVPLGKNPTIVLYTRVSFTTGGKPNCSDPAHNNSGDTSATLIGVLRPASGQYGKQLDVNNIDGLPLPLDDFTSSIKKGDYVSARCKSGNKKWHVKTVHTYSGGPPSPQPPVTVAETEKCKVKK